MGDSDDFEHSSYVHGSEPDGESGGIRLCPDGKYRWAYELPMMRNPVLLFTIWKILAIVVLFPALLFLICDLSNGVAYAIVPFVEVYLLVLTIMIVLSIIGYIILAASYGWKYIILFEMSDTEIVHAQMPKQFKKAEAIGWLVTMAGLLTSRPSMVGTGLLSASKSSCTSVFKNVDSVIGRRRMHTIKVNQLLSKNQVYVDDADYDFVWEFITERCTKAKIKA